jgi:hypothetical protein
VATWTKQVIVSFVNQRHTNRSVGQRACGKQEREYLRAARVAAYENGENIQAVVEVVAEITV